MDYHTRDAVITHIYKNLKGVTLDLDSESYRKMIAARVDELLRVFVPESFTGVHAYDPVKKVLTLSWTGSAELIRIRTESVVEVAMGAGEPLAWDTLK